LRRERRVGCGRPARWRGLCGVWACVSWVEVREAAGAGGGAAARAGGRLRPWKVHIYVGPVLVSVSV